MDQYIWKLNYCFKLIEVIWIDFHAKAASELLTDLIIILDFRKNNS